MSACVLLFPTPEPFPGRYFYHGISSPTLRAIFKGRRTGIIDGSPDSRSNWGPSRMVEA